VKNRKKTNRELQIIQTGNGTGHKK